MDEYPDTEIRACLHQLTRRTVREFAAAGHRLTQPEIIWVNDYARKVQNAADKVHSRGVPVLCGNTWLYPLTIGATRWLVWLSGQDLHDDIKSLAVIFAHAHAQDSAAIWPDCYELTIAVDRLQEFADKLNATDDQLTNAVAQLTARHRGGARCCSDTEVDDLALHLSRELGEAPDVWRWHESLDACLDLADMIRAQRQAQAGNGRRTSAEQPDAIRAQIEFDRAVQRLWAHYRGQVNG